MIKTERAIILGIDFDGAPVQKNDPLFVSKMGSLAFLDFLEIHSGLIPVQTSQLERIASFMAVLREHRGDFPFYVESWTRTPFNAARRMLEWIDTWYLHGWNGEMELPAAYQEQKATGIIELAALDSLSRNRVAPGIGKRLLDLTTVLSRDINIPLKKLILVDETVDWSAAWQRLFNTLSCKKESYSWNPEEIDSKKSRPLETVIMEYDCAVTATRYLAEFLDTEKPEKKSNFQIILEAEGNLRDEVLAVYGRPETGSRGTCSNDAESQILPLALSLQKEPLDMKALLAFLSLPVCPLGSIKHKLAESIAKTGGIHGTAWQEGIKKAKLKWKKRDKDDLELENFVDSWIPEQRQPEQVFSRETALITARMVIDFLKKFHDKKHEKALTQAALFCRAVELMGNSYSEVPWSILEEILSLVAGSSSIVSPLNKWEAGTMRPSVNPGAVFGDIDTLLWFSPQNVSPVSDWPWSDSQKSLLEANGCRFQPIQLLSSRPFRLARRILNRTRNKIILIVPSSRTELSPTEMLLKHGNITQSLIYKNSEKLILADKSSKTRAVIKTPLPGIKRIWSVSTNIAPGIEWGTSYSQTNIFINRPAQWLLERKACLRKGTILSLPELSALTGTCAHGMVEQLFTDFGDAALELDESSYQKWFERTFPRLLENFAYPYLETSAVQERINFRNKLNSSIRVLCSYLKDAGASKIKLEEKLKGKCFNASFVGSADLVFEKSRGIPGIIDMKYTGWKNRYIKKLEEDTDIQLTIYAELYSQQYGEVPETAYWLFPVERLLSRNVNFFPGAEYAESESSHQERLKMIEISVKWRKKQLSGGLVEIVSTQVPEIGDTEDEEQFLPPDGSLPIEDPYDLFDPCLSLYGWGADS